MLRDPGELQKHVLATYFSLRLGITIVAALLPIVLWGGEAILSGDLVLKGSMSAYYHSRVGDVFVGALFAIGAVLYLYKGFSKLENYVLNAAGVLVVGVALLPTKISAAMIEHMRHCECALETFTAPDAHTVAAVSFFLCIAFVAIFCAADTLHLINDPKRQRRYRAIYKTLGWAMVVVPLVAAALLYLLQYGRNRTERTIIFVVEALAVWIFAAYWAVKTREMAESNADAEAANKRMPPATKA
jgi:hypothetical protein